VACRLNDFIECGELINTKRFSTHGWLKLRGVETPLTLRLTGNCGPDLAGWHIRFESRGPRAEAGGEPDPDELARLLALDPPRLAAQQIGPTGDMTAARKVKIADCSAHELCHRCKGGEPPPFRWVRCLHLEWYSQNGRVVVELVDPILEYVDFATIPGVSADSRPSEPHADLVEEGGAPDAASQPGSYAGPCGEACAAEELDAEPDDPHGLFSQGDGEAEDDFLRQMGPTDDAIENSPGEPIGSLLDALGPLPEPDELSERQAEVQLKALLGQLARFGVALDVCEHFTARNAYRLLKEHILPEGRIHPELRGSDWVEHFTTQEHCAECAAQAQPPLPHEPRGGQEQETP